jgi:hypothetical protein
MMSDPKNQNQEKQEQELELDAEAVMDLEPEENDAQDVRGGLDPFQGMSRTC